MDGLGPPLAPNSVSRPLALENGFPHSTSTQGPHTMSAGREDSIDAQTVFAYTDNGWIKDYVGLEYLKNHFDKYAIPSKSGAVRLLLCDSHSSHDTYEFKEYCIEHNIAFFYFPSHATHLLQPLDVGVFGPLDRYCSQEVDTWTASQPLATPLFKADFLPTCEHARKEGVTEQNIRKAWVECGIHPYGPGRHAPSLGRAPRAGVWYVCVIFYL